MISFNVKTIALDFKLKERKQKICEEVARQLLPLCEPYIPKESGGLIASGKIEDGTKLTWDRDYARQQFYHGRGRGSLRGKKWVFRAWHKNKTFILKEVKTAL